MAVCICVYGTAAALGADAPSTVPEIAPPYRTRNRNLI